MTDLDALLAGIVADPSNAVRWLVMADWLEENGEPERAELVRVHRELLRTCTVTRETKARKQLHARMMELMRAGVQPCIPTRTITLPGGVEMRFSFIPPGSFLMGSPKSEEARGRDERLHLVTLTKGYWLGQTPVTQAQWRAVMRTNPSDFSGDTLPVENMSWEDTQAFCIQVRERTGADARLPTEAEWEYAARSGTTTPYYWGWEYEGITEEFLYSVEVNGSRQQSTMAVGRYAMEVPHSWALTDVIGNVWEWCHDWRDDYPDGDTTDPVGPEHGMYKVHRGGSMSKLTPFSRAACRLSGSPNVAGEFTGFRVAADLSALA